MKKKVVVYWLKRSYRQTTRNNICNHFGVKSEMSINGETIFEIDTDDTKLIGELMKLEDEKYLQIRFKKL